MPSFFKRRRFLAYSAGVVVALSSALWPSSVLQAQTQPTAGVTQTTVFNAELYTALKEGGLVIYFRHGRTNKGGVDRIEWPREQQRLLSQEGELQARQIGEAFKRHGFAIGEVLSSPFARCSEMAQIAFGRTEHKMELLGILSDSSGREARINYSQALVNQSVPAGQNRIIVGHSSNIRESSGQSIAEGDAVVLRPRPQGAEVLAVLSPEDWDKLN